MTSTRLRALIGANSPTAARSSGAPTAWPVRTSPGRVDEHEGHVPRPMRFLSRARRVDDRGRVDALDPRRQALRGEQLGHLGAQRVLAGEAQRGEQAEADRLAVAVARRSRWPSRWRGRRCGRG